MGSEKAEFRQRLQRVVERVGRKAVARPEGTPPAGDDDDSVSQGGLTKILNGNRANPGVFTIKDIARKANVTVGELLGEVGFDVSGEDQEEIHRFVRWAEAKLLRSAPAKIDPREAPNASPIRIKFDEDDEKRDGRVSKRGAGQPNNVRHMAPRLPAAATPNRGTFFDGGDELPMREIPTHYWNLGARLVRKAEGDSMRGAGITNNDLLFARPESDAQLANGKLVVCEVKGSEYVKKLVLTDGGIRLVSFNDSFGEWILDHDEAESFRLVGVVVGRSGYPDA